MKTSVRALAILAAAGLAACATLRTTADYDRSVDFSKYRTYKWIDTGDLPENSIVAKRLTSAVDRQLRAKGLAPAEPADLLVAMHARLSRQLVYHSEALGWGYGRGWWRGNVVYTRPQEIPVGTMVVDLVDARTDELVWRGVARRVLDPTASIEEKERDADESASRLFESYPPPR
jgi:hypothetical protein